MADGLVVQVDTRQIEDLANVLQRGGELAIRRLAERGEQHLRKEVPRVTNNLAQGITSTVRIATGKFEADLIVSARSGRRGARQATVHYPSGKTKDVKLRPQPAFDYAEVVARGRKEVRPRNAKVLLIPVSSPPAGEAYITSGGETFILRPRAQATKANPYDERALRALDGEAERIVTEAYQKAGLL